MTEKSDSFAFTININNSIASLSSTLNSFELDPILQEIQILTGFYLFIVLFGFFAHFLKNQCPILEFIYQLLTLLSLLVTFYLMNFIIDKRNFLFDVGENSFKSTIRGYLKNELYWSTWLQLCQKFLYCCGWNSPIIEFNSTKLPLTCCKDPINIDYETLVKNGFSYCSNHQIHSNLSVCSRSFYFEILSTPFWLWLAINILIQIAIFNIVINIYCRSKYFNY